MGCCGCDNKASTNTAGIFAIVQCIVGFSLAIYNLNIFNRDCSQYSSKGYACYVLYSYTSTIRALLIVAIVLYIIWIISSILLLIGNAQNKAGFLRQWVGLSTVVIICDVVFPIIIVATTYSAIITQINNDSYDYPGFRKSTYSYYNTTTLSWDYFCLLLTFSRGGLITWCSDIALTVFVSRRATEITNPQATYVYTQAYPTTVVTSSFPPQYIQQGFVAPQQGFVQPQQGYVVQPQPQQYYQPLQFNQPAQFNQPQQFNQQLPYNQPIGSNNMGPPPDYSYDQK